MVRDLDQRWRPRRPWLIGAAAFLLLAAALAACQVPSRQPPAAPRTATLTASYQGVTASALAHGRWSPLPAAPILDRDDPVGVWTGQELLVWGGRSGLHVAGDGAAYDPAHDTWRRLAPSPQPRGSLMAQHLVWTGTRLLVWSDWRQTLRSDAVTLANGERGVEMETRDGVDVWAYDPAADRWAVLPPAPGQPALGGAVMLWTGREVRAQRDWPALRGTCA